MKVIIIGLDGASFELIEPWIEEGVLPNIKWMREKGVYGDMRSCLPPVTAPNWKCYSTGKNPGKLGIFWWENIDVKNKRVYYPQDRTKFNRELVDIIGETGKVASINMPTTYPPKKVNGILISGPPDSPEDEFFYPDTDTMQKTLEDLGYKIRPEKEDSLRSESKENQEEVVEEIKEIIRTKFDFAHKILKEEKPIFLHLTIFYINVLHHFFWDAEYTKEAWKLIDEKIGEFLDDFGDEYTFFFMSDHGSNKITTVFNINTWLEKNGYLVTTASKAKLLNSIGINAQNLARIFNLLGSERLKRVIKCIVPDKILNTIPTEEGTFDRERKTGVIDWGKTKAVASTQGPLYILAKGNEKEEIKRGLIKDLEPMKDKGVISGIYTRENIYSGKYLEEAPDLILDQGKGIHIKGDIGREKIFEQPDVDVWRAENKKIGLFMAYGPKIKSGKKINDISILDLAPTILHFFNIAIPRDMDGKVLKEIFEEGSEPAERPIEYQKIGGKKWVNQKVKELKKSGKV
jgi:predicted AlkP superfamily phosphohydrolase/phosphomutase